MTVTKVSVCIIALVSGIFAYRFLSVESALPDTEPATVRLPPESDSAGRPPPVPVAPPAARQEVRQNPDCLEFNDYLRQPLVQRMVSRQAVTATSGADIEKYRGLEEAEVRGYADQGDSAAMVVVGAMSVMRAYNKDATLGTDWLASGGQLAGVLTPDQQLTSESGLSLNDAAFWFYQAAVSGRVFALQHYGQVRSELFGGPVGLGWISQEAYDDLDEPQQSAISVARVYQSVALELAPIPEASVIEQDSNAVVAQIRNDIHTEFNVAVEDSGNQPDLMTATDLTDYAMLRAQLCRE